MRRIVLGILGAALAALVIARGLVPPAVPAWGAEEQDWDSGAYNVLALDIPVAAETAGSALIGEMNSYFLSCRPTEKSEYTGLAQSANLIVILAENWPVAYMDENLTPGLYRLWLEGAKIAAAYAPEWYQGVDGREFALLSGMEPTTIRNKSALVWAAEQDVALPFALARCLARTGGYTCRAYPSQPEREELYETLGFETVEGLEGSALDRIGQTLPALAAEEEPFFAYYVWEEPDGNAALGYLLSLLEGSGLASNTVVCLWAGHQDELRGHWFLWGPALREATVTGPCSELDVTPTLLNLLGVAYDSRFLSGRDVFAPAGDVTATGHAMALVSLYGSAYADWVTDAGSYAAGERIFFPGTGIFETEREAEQYAQQVRRLVYDRYAFARRVMESNYFGLICP